MFGRLLSVGRASEYFALGKAEKWKRAAFRTKWITRLSVTLQRSLGAKELSLAQEIDWAKYGSSSAQVRPKGWYYRNRPGELPMADDDLENVVVGHLMDIE